MSKKSLLFAMLIMSIAEVSSAVDFVRQLPTAGLLKAVEQYKGKGRDAVIILKEESMQIVNKTVDYRGLELSGNSTQHNKVLIVKLFNEMAVKRYGNFEFEYFEPYGDELPNAFQAHVRVLKEDGSIYVMPEEEVRIIISRKNSSNDPIARKVLFKVPNLKPGDVLQIETFFNRLFSRSFSGLFYHQERDLILFNNLYITLPLKEKAEFKSFPAGIIGPPREQQISQEYGAGKTYYWNLKNLEAIPDEPYSLPFSDQSYLTTFVVNSISFSEVGEWDRVFGGFSKDYLDKDDVDDDYIDKLGFENRRGAGPVTLETVDSLYAALRRRIVLLKTTSLYPQSEDINEIFETGKGDASDLAYAMSRILNAWGVENRIILIRDRRRGAFRQSVPTLRWFDRLGVEVTLDSTTCYYDFDKSVSYNYQRPWYLNGVTVAALDAKHYQFVPVGGESSYKDNTITETHILRLDETGRLRDSLLLRYKGEPAHTIREKYYFTPEEEIKNDFEKHLNPALFQQTDFFAINDFLEEPVVEVRFAGIAATQTELLEKNLILTLKNYMLRDFYQKLTSTGKRRGQIYFNEPFQMVLNWRIALPPGYEPATGLEKTRRLLGPLGMISAFTISQKEGELHIQLRMKVKKRAFKVGEFNKIRGFLTRQLALIEQNLIFNPR